MRAYSVSVATFTIPPREPTRERQSVVPPTLYDQNDNAARAFEHQLERWLRDPKTGMIR